MTMDNMRIFQVFGDFDAIVFKDCFEVKWSKDMTTLPNFVVELHAFRGYRAAYRRLRL